MGKIAIKSSATLAGLIAALAVAAPLAIAAEEPTRAEYVERVEPICKANAEANSRILKGVKGQVQQGALVPAGKRFVRASGALARAVTELAREPQPSADSAKLDKWIGYLRQEKSFLRRIGQALKADDKPKAQQIAVRLNRTNNQANNTVISFGFDHCRIDSSAFL